MEQYKEYEETGHKLTPYGLVFVKDGGNITVHCDPTVIPGWVMSYRGVYYTTVSPQ